MTDGAMERGHHDETARKQRLARSWQHQDLAAEFLAMGARKKTLDVPYPLFLSEGQGAYVWDVDGNRYLDMVMGFGPHVLGHRPPAVEEALKSQIEKGWHFGLTNNLQSELAAALVRAYGGSGKVQFSGSGSEAVMCGVRLARAFTGRAKVAVFDGAYHGNADYVLLHADPESPADAPGARITGAGIPGAIIKETMVMLPYRRDAAFGLIAENARELAAILVQPVQNSLPRSDNGQFLRALRELCDVYGILLIFDEVVTGLRLAYGGGREYFGIHPDLAAFGKALGGGLPVGAIWGRDEVMALLAQDNSRGGVFSSGTFNANPLTVAAGLAMMRQLEDHRNTIYPRLEAMGARVAGEVNACIQERQMRAKLMQAGSLLCLHFARGPFNSSRDITGDARQAKQAFFLEMLDRGVLMPAGRMTLLSDAHQDTDVEFLIDSIRQSLGVLHERGLI